MSCLSEDALLGIIDGTLPPVEDVAAREHMSECGACLALVAHLIRQSDPVATPSKNPAPEELELRSDVRIGRFEVVGPIGAGGMGIIYSAWDPELGRPVALKLVRAVPAEPGQADAARKRVLREAQAMARLKHPNVVAIYDVGEWEGRVFIAMELVEGGTLTLW